MSTPPRGGVCFSAPAGLDPTGRQGRHPWTRATFGSDTFLRGIVPAIFATAAIASVAMVRGESGAGAAPSAPDIRPERVLWTAAYRAIPDTAIDTRAFVPLWSRVGGYTTRIHIQNADVLPADATIELFDALGAPLACGAPCNLTIAPKDIRVLDLASVGSVAIGTTGSAVVTGNKPIAVVVERVAQYDNGDDLAAYEAAVLDESAVAVEIPAVFVEFAFEFGASPASSVVHVQNLGGAVTGVTLEVRDGFGGSVTLGPTAADPGGAVAFDIASSSAAPLGAGGKRLYAVATASQPIAAVVNTRSLDSVLTSGHAESWQRDVRSDAITWIPSVLKGLWGRCTSIRYRASGGFVTFDLFGLNPPAGPVPDRSVVLPSGGPAGEVRPFCSSVPFESLPSNYMGALRITYGGSPVQPTDAYAFHWGSSPGVGVAGPAVAGFEGSPLYHAAPRLHVPMIHADWPAYGPGAAGPRLESAIVVTNPSSAEASVTVKYLGALGACEGMSFDHGPRVVPVAGSTRFDLGVAGGSGLPAPCVGSAIIESSQPILAVVLDEAYLDPPPPCVDAPSGLTAWWPLDESIGSPTARELVGGRDGTVGGAARNFQPGRVGNALFFDGVASGDASDHVEVPDHPALDAGTGNLTLDAWIKVAPEDLASVAPRVIVQKLSFTGGQFGYGLQVTDGALELLMADGTLATYRTATKLPTDGDWHFVAVVVDRTSAPDPVESVRFYVDGLEQPKATGAGLEVLPRTGNLDNDRPLRIGARTINFPQQIFKGGIDEVELFKAALSDEEIATIAESGAGGKCKPTPGPSPTPTATATHTATPIPPCVPTPANMVAWWTFDEGAGKVVHDRTANQYDGDLNYGTGWAAGKVDGSYYFPPQHILHDILWVDPGGPLTVGTSDFSIDTWIKEGTNANPYEPRIVDNSGLQGGVSYRGILFGTDKLVDRLQLSMADGVGANAGTTTYWSSIAAADLIPDDHAWHHVGVTVQRTSPTGGRFYIDGEEAGTFDPTGRKGSLNSSHYIHIGPQLNSHLDELQIYHRALSHDEISGIYDAGPSGKCKFIDPCPMEIALADSADSSAAVAMSDAASPTPSLPEQTRDPLSMGGAPDDFHETASTLDNLRSVRKIVLDPDLIGDRLARTYDRHSPEVVGILLADSDLRAEARGLLVDLEPFYAPLVDSARPPLALTATEVERIRNLIVRLADRSEPALAAELADWHSRAAAWDGLTADQIWARERVVLPENSRRAPVSEVVVSSALPRWEPERLNDGRSDPAWSSQVHVEHLAGAEWAAIRLPWPTAIDGVRLSPRRDPSDSGNGLGFPKDFVVQYSFDLHETTCNPDSPRFYEASNWLPLVTKVGFSLQSSEPVTFNFAPRTARCVRVFGAELSQDDYGNRYLQMAEIEALVGGTAVGGATAVVSSSINRWPAARLVDSELDEAWSSRAHTEHLEGAEWAAIRLGSTSSVDGVRLLPRSDPANPGRSLGFPKDLVVQYSIDGEGLTCDPSSPRFAELGNWKPLTTKVGFNQPPDLPVDFAFEARPVGCLRLFGAELSQDDYGNRYLQLDEFQALAGDTVVPAESAIVSSAIGSWPSERLIDGETGTVWSSRPHTEHLAGAEWAAVRLAEPSTIVGLWLYPRRDPTNPESSLGFPKDFVLQSSTDGNGKTCDPADPRFAELGNWSPISTHVGFEQPSSQPVLFSFEPREAGCVRVFGAELSQDDYGNRYLQLGEIEVLRAQP